MYKFLLLSAFLLSGLTYSSAQQIQLSNATVDLGNISIGEKAMTTIDIKNIGDKPLLLNNVSSACDCLKITWSNSPIAAGNSATITVEYTKTAIEGAFNQSVIISSNAVDENRKIIRIKGFVQK